MVVSVAMSDNECSSTASAYSRGTPATASVGITTWYPRSSAVSAMPNTPRFTDTPVATTVRTNIAGTQAAFYRERGREYPIIVRLRPEDRQRVDNVNDVLVSTPTGRLVQAKSLIALEPCRISDADGLSSTEARCGKFSVPEDPDDPKGARIDLAIAVVPAVATKAKPDPIFLIAGGPGQGSIEGYAPILGAFGGIHRERDLVLGDLDGSLHVER